MLIPLGQRLKTIAGHVPTGCRVADIGSDHGYLPAWLAQSGRARMVIAGEINADPARRARETCFEFGLEDQMEVRLGDGLQVIQPDEVDVIVISGMGGTTIRQILEQGRAKLDGVMRLVLQPNVAAPELRAWLVANGFMIKEESLVEENHIIYEVIAAEPGQSAPLSSLQLLIGPVLLAERPALFCDFVSSLIADRRYVLRQLENAHSAEAATRRERFAREIAELEQAIP